REDGAEHERHLTEDVAGMALADRALDAVDPLDRLDASLEEGEERRLAALVRGVLPRHEADIRRHPRQLLPLGLVERREQRDSADLLGRHHARLPNGRVILRPTPPTQLPRWVPRRNAIRFAATRRASFPCSRRLRVA